MRHVVSFSPPQKSKHTHSQIGFGGLVDFNSIHGTNHVPDLSTFHELGHQTCFGSSTVWNLTNGERP